MIALRQFGTRFFSSLKALLGRSQPRGSANERRGNTAKSSQVAFSGSRSNGGIRDFSTLQKMMEELQKASEGSRRELMEALRELASASDKADPYTRGHSERVTRFSVEIAKIMGLPEEEIEQIRIGALTHDIGKITIDRKVLNKAKPLTNSEYELIKTHTTRGYELLKDVPQLKDILPGVRSHHEQLDGKGYPHGLKGDEIPMIARIISVADCFDAMITARPYQDPTPTEHALGLLRYAAGIKYDSRVVEALVQGVRIGRIMTRSEDRMKREA